MNRLYRSRETRIIAGVAGGLAEYFQVDVVLIRLLWLIAAFAGGGGIPVYIIAWIVIPEEKGFASGKEKKLQQSDDFDSAEQKGEAVVFHGEGTPAKENRSEWRRRRNAGLLLIGLGIIFLAHQITGPFFYYFWPLLIIAAGIFLLWREGKEAGK